FVHHGRYLRRTQRVVIHTHLINITVPLETIVAIVITATTNRPVRQSRVNRPHGIGTRSTHQYTITINSPLCCCTAGNSGGCRNMSPCIESNGACTNTGQASSCATTSTDIGAIHPQVNFKIVGGACRIAPASRNGIASTRCRRGGAHPGSECQTGSDIL